MPGADGISVPSQALQSTALERGDRQDTGLVVQHRGAQAQERDPGLLLELQTDQQHGGRTVEVRERDLQRATGHVVAQEGLLLGGVRARPAVDVVGAERDAGELAVRVGVLERQATAGQDGPAGRGLPRVRRGRPPPAGPPPRRRAPRPSWPARARRRRCARAGW